ncbi:MAG TPA: DNA-processing protein DprA [Candidatus Kapabacteria bacterium]|nr:DNA-processing protein DprA [Candidatus Kapabacteria bacterium]
MQLDELRFYYALYLSKGIGAGRLITLRTYFGSSERIFNASSAQLASAPGIGKIIAQEIHASKELSLKTADEHLTALPEGVSIITFFDTDYPESLRNIFNPPALLFIHGEPALLRLEKNIAVIGSRRITDYGKRVTSDLCKTFAEHGVTVTSGFALGVDTAAHRAVYESGGTTIAVLGSGIDVIYPPSNKSFAKELIASGRGLIASELPLGAKPDAKNFPWRNRIVSGLSSASVIIESDEKGGSMITASIALDQNREVFALPGDVDRPMSRGPNQLLSDNRAKAFRNGLDVLSALEWVNGSSESGKRKSQRKQPHFLTNDDKQLYNILEVAGEPIHIDTIVERSGLDVQTSLVRLLEMEFQDVVRQLPGKFFSTIF